MPIGAISNPVVTVTPSSATPPQSPGIPASSDYRWERSDPPSKPAALSKPPRPDRKAEEQVGCSHSGNIPSAKDKAAQSDNQPRIRWDLAESRSASGHPLLVAVVRPQPAKQSASVRTRAHRSQPMERAPSTEARAAQHPIPRYGDAVPATNGAMLQAFRDIRSGLLDARRHVRQAKMHEWIHHERAVLDVVRRLRDLAPAATYEYADEDRTIRTAAVMLLDRLQFTDSRPGQ